MHTRRGVLALVGLMAAALGSIALANPPPASGDPGAQATQPGSWTTHQTDFWFMGVTSTYSCDGLGDKLLLLLRQLGARADAKAMPLCSRGFGRPDPMAEARISFASLSPASAAAAAPAADAGVPGVWRHIYLAPRKPAALQGGDCELVEEFRDKVLPLFAVRNVDSRISCVPHQATGDQYYLAFDVFVPATPDSKS